MQNASGKRANERFSDERETRLLSHKTKNPSPLRAEVLKMVPEKGLEPTRPCGHCDLNAARLPIPPLRQLMTIKIPCVLHNTNHIVVFFKQKSRTPLEFGFSSNCSDVCQKIILRTSCRLLSSRRALRLPRLAHRTCRSRLC